MKRQKTFEQNNPKLYIVSTPIGNLEDITFRAISTLKAVDYIYCEDTRTTIKLLNHYEINTSLRAYHLFNENNIKNEIIGLIQQGKSIAIVSDAGSPGISDPGWSVINEAIQNDIDVVIVPGVSASITGLVGSGISTEKYFFYGFISPKKQKREEELKKIYSYPETIIIYEAPHRIKATLESIKQIMGDRKIGLCRELTKRFEEYLRGTAEEILSTDFEVKGEMVIVIEGNKNAKQSQNLNEMTIAEHYQYYTNQGFDNKSVLKMISVDRNISKSDIYKELFVKK